MTDTKLLLTPDEAEEQLGYSRKQTLKLAREGAIRFQRKNARVIRFEPDALTEYIEKITIFPGGRS
jgi:excisionase family DNA binding protein